jgi:hypothetical protein
MKALSCFFIEDLYQRRRGKLDTSSVKAFLQTLRERLLREGYGLKTQPDSESEAMFIYVTKEQLPPLFLGKLEILQTMNAQEP